MKQAIKETRESFWSRLRASRLSFGQQDIAVHELNLSGDRVLLGLAIAVFSMGPLLWAFVRYWLFAP